MRSIVFVAPTLVPFVTLASFSAFGNELTLEKTFLTISFISILRFPLLLIPQSYAYYFEVSVTRAGNAPVFRLTPHPPRSRPTRN